MSERDDEDLIKIGRKKKNKKNKNSQKSVMRPIKRISGENVSRGTSKSERTPIKVDLFEGDRREKIINREYQKTSNRYRAAKYISVILLTAFLLTMLLFYGESITYENFMYLVRDLDSAEDSGYGVYSDINYGEVFASDIEMFKGKIALASTSGVTVYNAAGTTDLESSHIYASPVISAGEKYMLVYDRNSTGYSVYNSVSRILKDNTSEKIEEGVIGDDGSFALLTRSSDTKYVVSVFGSDLRPMMKYYKDKYVVGMAISPDGEQISIISVSVSGARTEAEIETGYLGSKKTVDLTLSGMMPISAYYADDDTLTVIFDSAVVGIRDGKEVFRIDFSGKNPGAADFEKGFSVLSCRLNVTGTENELTVFDKNGKILYNEPIGIKVSFVSSDGDKYVYAAGDGKAVRINVSDKSTTEEKLPERTEKLLSPEGNLIACTETGTVTLFAD